MMEISLNSCSTTIAPHQILSSAALKIKPFRAATGPGTLVRHEHARWLSSVKIYTRTGDEGETGLFGGGRVPKDHPRVSAYGEVDELNSFLGLARSIEPNPRIDEILLSIQRDLLAIGALLATPNPTKMREHLSKARIDDKRIREMEQAIDAADLDLEPLKAF